MSVSSVTQHSSPRPTVLRAEELKTKVKRLPLVTGPRTMVLEDKIAVNVAKFLAPLPPQDAPNPAVTAEMAQPPAPVVETVRHGRIVRSVPIAVSVAQPSAMTVPSALTLPSALTARCVPIEDRLPV